ncbi:MAG: trimeric intracellular cation channel family protein [Candidatus Cloacimonadales bacterium]
MLYFFDLFGTLIFAMTGALRATKHNLDILGLLVLSVVTGVFGGVIRDLIIGDTMPLAFRDERYLLIAILGGMLVFFAAPKIARQWNVVRYLDAVGLGIFAAIGATKALHYGAGPVGVIMLSAITATGGGMIRDIFVQEIPAVLRRDFYATAAILGAISLLCLDFLGYSENLQILACTLLTAGIRFAAIIFDVHLPTVKRAEGDF